MKFSSWMFVSSVIFAVYALIVESQDWDSQICQDVEAVQASKYIEVHQGTGCVAKGSVPRLEQCAFHWQCGTTWCYDEWKRCYDSGNVIFPYSADCQDCSGEFYADVNQCECKHEDFPNNWVKCTNGSEGYDFYEKKEAEKPYVRTEDSNGALSVDDPFAQAITCYHNKYRQEGAGMAPVKWNSELALFVKNYLKTIMDEVGSCSFGHSDDRQDIGGFAWIGENIVWQGLETHQDLPTIARKGVEWWYNELKDYSYPGGEVGFTDCPETETNLVLHFSQVVWQDTTDIGCDYINCQPDKNDPTQQAGLYGITCVYGPTGNYLSQPIFDEASWCNLTKWSHNEQYEMKRCDGKNCV